MIDRLLPCVGWLRRYDAEAFRGDALAAVIVTIMLIPQSLAYAMLAGLPPEVGLYASMLPLVAYALFGSSNALAVGPVVQPVGHGAALAFPSEIGHRQAPMHRAYEAGDDRRVEQQHIDHESPISRVLYDVEQGHGGVERDQTGDGQYRGDRGYAS